MTAMRKHRNKRRRAHGPVEPGSFSGGLIAGVAILFGLKKAVEFLVHPKTAEIVDNFNRALARKK
jgi:hypothetical protein